MGQRKRKPVVSKGLTIGSRKIPQTVLANVLMGKGLFQTFRPIGSTDN